MPRLMSQLPSRDLVLSVEGEFLDVGVAVVVVIAAAAGEVVGQQVGVEGAADGWIVGDEAGAGALGWVGEAGQRVAAAVDAG